LDDLNIRAAYQNARTPRIGPDDVKQVELHWQGKDFEEQVNSLYEEVRKYFEKE
jgi:hypothetical protein